MVSYIAIIVSAVVAFVIGMLWYSPLLFGKAWIKLMGFSDKDMQKAKEKGMSISMVIALISVLVMSYVLNWLIVQLGYSDALSGAVLGFLIWLGFLATTMVNGVLWESKPWALYFINILHYLVVLVVIGAILAVWS